MLDEIKFEKYDREAGQVHELSRQVLEGQELHSQDDGPKMEENGQITTGAWVKSQKRGKRNLNQGRALNGKSRQFKGGRKWLVDAILHHLVLFPDVF